MEHSRKQKLLIIVALIIGIASLSIGFAAFSVSLNISSSASVSPNSDTFSVKFSTEKDSLVVSDVTPSSITSGITATNGKINNSTNPTITGLKANFTEPGQYIEYTFYARNEGEYTAYLNNINFIGNKICTAEKGTTDDLVQSACEDIAITTTIGSTVYTETTPISGHYLEKRMGEKIIVRLEYNQDGAFVDGPFYVNFPSITLVYSTIDDSTIEPTIINKPTLLNGDLNTIGSIVAIGDEQFYIFGQENGNIKLLSMYNLHVGKIVKESILQVEDLENPTGIQDKTARGYVAGESQGIYPYIGTTEFSSDSQKGTEYSDYEGSVVQIYVNNYQDYLEKQGAIISSSRLITKEELESLGCSSTERMCTSAPEWVYQTSYWGMTPNGSTGTWNVYNTRDFNGANCSVKFNFGVRPVIEIPISEFE